MSFGPGGAGDTKHDADSTTVDSYHDFGPDVSDDNGEDNGDASWEEAAAEIDTSVFLCDDEQTEESEETTFESDDDNDSCDGQLSLFEADDEEVDVQPLDSEETQSDETADTTEDDNDDATWEEADEFLADEEKSSSKETEDDEPVQVDIEEYLEYREDLHHTPSYNSRLGQWQGRRGDSLFVPSDPDAQRVLSELGLAGIPYREAQPDFSEVTAATVYLSQQDMELSDAKQKAMANETLADDLDEDLEDEDERLETVDAALVEAVLADEDKVDEFCESLQSGSVPDSFVWHHEDADADGDYPFVLIPSVIHDACRHRGGRSHSKTKRN